MKVVSVAPQIDMSRESRIIALGSKLHLQGERQIILYIRIIKVGDVSICPGSAQPIKIHDFRRLFSVYLRDQMGVFRYTVPVKVYDYLNRRICLQNRTYGCLRIFIGITPVELSIDNIINTGIMDRLNSFFI